MVKRPAFAAKKEACSIVIYANERKRDASVEYKFTLARSARVYGQFKTCYSFRRRDVEALKSLLDDAAAYIAEREIENAAKDAARESEEV